VLHPPPRPSTNVPPMDPSDDSPAVIVGLGEMGGVFARALLRAGHPVFPVLRGDDPAALAARLPHPEIALVAVAEADLNPVLTTFPAAWRPRAGLLQNELLPRDWEAHDLSDPTVAVVWFEKKPGRPVTPILPTPVGGPGAGLLAEALSGIGIPAVTVDREEALLFELVRKNLYILTVNIAGLVTGGTVGALWHDHRPLATEVASEVLDLQEWLCGTVLDREALLAGMVDAIEADLDHGATGRSAPVRLARALRHAAEAGIAVPRLAAIQATLEAPAGGGGS
jgi:ketopantoate reductase